MLRQNISRIYIRSVFMRGDLTMRTHCSLTYIHRQRCGWLLNTPANASCCLLYVTTLARGKNATHRQSIVSRRCVRAGNSEHSVIADGWKMFPIVFFSALYMRSRCNSQSTLRLIDCSSYFHISNEWRHSAVKVFPYFQVFVRPMDILSYTSRIEKSAWPSQRMTFCHWWQIYYHVLPQQPLTYSSGCVHNVLVMHPCRSQCDAPQVHRVGVIHIYPGFRWRALGDRLE